VLINNLPHVMASHRCTCVAGPPDFIVTGASTVLVGNLPAGRATEKTMHGQGVLVGASPDVLIGGASTGVSLGGGASALGACTAAAGGRASGSTQQSYGNCGVESARQIINRATGADLDEEGLVEDAVAHGEVEPSAVKDHRFGGTHPAGCRTLLERHGVPSSEVSATQANLMQAVAEGRGVISSHDAGLLWNDPTHYGGGHAVVMTGVTFDASGNPESVTFNDTGTGHCGNTISAKQFFGSLRPNRPANITDRPIW